MDEFQEALLGQLARDTQAVLRDLKRQTRALVAPSARETSYNAHQSAAAQGVAAAFARVDDVFSRQRLSDPFNFCDCCTDPALVERLMQTPRDGLSEDDMAVVAGSLLHTLGCDDDMRYFVPRFCSDSMGTPLYDVDSVFARFARAGFDGWPDREKAAVRDFLAAHWRFQLLVEPPAGLAELTDPCFTTLDCIASVGDVGRALAIWDDVTAETADARLLELLDRLDVRSDTIAIVGVGGFDDNAGAYTSIARWLRSGPVRARIDAALASLQSIDVEKCKRIAGVRAALARLP